MYQEENTEDEEVSDLEAINLSCSSESEDDTEAMDDTASIATSIAELTTGIVYFHSNIQYSYFQTLTPSQYSFIQTFILSF